MKSLYKLLEELTYKCEGMGTSNTSIENCSLEINEINTYLNNVLNTTECFYFSLLVILNLGEKRIAPLKHFAQHLKCKPIDVIESIEILNNFYKKGIVERVSDHRDRVGNKGFTDYSYYVSDKQFQQLLEGTIKFEKSENKVTTGISLIKKNKATNG